MSRGRSILPNNNFTQKKNHERKIARKEEKKKAKFDEVYQSIRSDRPTDALEKIKELLKSNPFDIALHLAIGRCYEKMNKIAEAEKHYLKLLDERKEDYVKSKILLSLYYFYSRCGYDNDKLKEILNSIPQSKKCVKKVRFAWIDYYINNQQYQQAKNILDAFVNKKDLPSYVQEEIRLMEVVLQIHLDDKKSNEAFFAQFSPNVDRKYMLNWVTVFSEVFLKIKKINNYEVRNRCLLTMKKHTVEIIKQLPTHHRAQLLLAEILFELAEVKQANERMELIFKKFPTYWDAYIYYGQLLTKQGDHIQSIQEFTKVTAAKESHSVDTQPTNTQLAYAYNGLAINYKLGGDKEEWKKCAKLCISSDKDYAPGYSILGKYYHEAGDEEKAKKCFEIARKLDPPRFEKNHSLEDRKIESKIQYSGNMNSHKNIINNNIGKDLLGDKSKKFVDTQKPVKKKPMPETKAIEPKKKPEQPIQATVISDQKANDDEWKSSGEMECIYLGNKVMWVPKKPPVSSKKRAVNLKKESSTTYKILSSKMDEAKLSNHSAVKHAGKKSKKDNCCQYTTNIIFNALNYVGKLFFHPQRKPTEKKQASRLNLSS